MKLDKNIRARGKEVACAARDSMSFFVLGPRPARVARQHCDSLESTWLELQLASFDSQVSTLLRLGVLLHHEHHWRVGA